MAECIDEKSTDDRSILVPLKNGIGPPILFFHGPEGHLVTWSRFSRHSESEKPTWGLQSPELAGHSRLDSIEQISDLFADEIVKQFAGQQVILCGFSFGGILAFETCRLVQRMGIDVLDVIVFDTRTIHIPKLVHLQSNAWFFTYRMWYHARRILTSPITTWPSYVRDRAQSFRHIYSKGGRVSKKCAVNGQSGEAKSSLSKHHLDLLSHHQPTRLPQHVTLIRASNELRDPRPGWSWLTGGRLNVVDIACQHHQLLTDNVSDSSRAFDEILEQISQID